jgi:hypothetical protein
MAITRTESKVWYGYADLWYAAENTAAPTSTTTLQDPGAAGYTGLGFSGEGAELEISKDLTDIMVEEQLTAVDTVVTGLTVMVRMQLAEDTIENRQLTMGIGTLVTTAYSAGVQIPKKTLTLGSTLAKKAIVMDVTNPLGYTTRLYIPSVAAVATVQTTFKRAEKRLYPLEFKALCDPSTITILEQSGTS